VRDLVFGRPTDFSSASKRLCDPSHEIVVHYLFIEPSMPRSRSRPATPQFHETGDVKPTSERHHHGPVERVDRPIADDLGRPARPYRAIDTLAAMERRGTITARMRQAGEEFRASFAAAQLDPLQAFDLSRARAGRHCGFRSEDGPGLRTGRARDAVWHAILAVGGPRSPGGSCLWHVVGWERSLKDWALEQGWNGRRVSQEAASGILIAALGALEAHFANSRRC
jgi:hypothetical protein